MGTKEHDKLAYRLVTILQKLNDGEKLDPSALAREFNVNVRTIQRDFNDRLSFLPLEKNGGRYSVDATYLGGRMGYDEMERFATLAGLQRLFPALNKQFLREIFDLRMQDTFMVQSPQFEDAGVFQEAFRTLQKAISDRLEVSFRYQKADGRKLVRAHPYKLINHVGIWYLAAADQDHGGKIKAYTLGKIDAIFVGDTLFTIDAAVQTMLHEEDSIWLTPHKTEAVLKVEAPVAHYFKRRKLIASQKIVKELDCGGLHVSGKFAHPSQVIPIVRYWIPHVRILSPDTWQADLEQQLSVYLQK